MNRTYLRDLAKAKENSKVFVQGWVAEIRNLSKVKFIILRDKTDTVQIVAVKGKTPDKAFDEVAKISVESAVAITGMLKKNKEAKLGYEVVLENIEVLNQAQTPLPIDTSEKSKTQIDKRLDFRFLDARRPSIRAIFTIRSRIAKATVDFFDQEGFTNINTPKITEAGVESGAEMFAVKYFNKKAFLSQSPQIYKQMFVAAGFERVYEIGPVFRAEKSHTTRHTTEFTGVDFEMGFIKDERDVMMIIEKYLIHVVTDIKKHCAKELELLNVKLPTPKKVPHITMQEARELLAKAGKKISDNDDFDPEAEKMIGEITKKKFGEDIIFVSNYPWDVRPFYHMKPENDPKGTCSFDVIWNGVEIGTGAQREHRYDILKKQAKEKGIDLDQMEDYANIFRYGAVPHGGIGFGLDRITQCMLNLPNVREVILLPRDTERLTP